MFARILELQWREGMMEKAVETAQEHIRPVMASRNGFKGWLVLNDTHANKTLSISLWDSEAEMLSGETDSYLEQQIQKVAPFMEGLPRTEHYQVAVQEQA